jgi:hypothetical protein
MTTANEKIDEIERGFKELLTEREPEILSGNKFHIYVNNLLVNYLDFASVGERNIIYQFYRDITEYNPFGGMSPKGFIRDIPRSLDNLEILSKNLDRYLAKKPKPENYSRMSVYQRNVGEKVTVLSHHRSPQDLLEGKLRSKNIDESTTIVSRTGIGLKKFVQTLKFIKGKNLGDSIMKGERLVTRVHDQDAIPMYKRQFLLSPQQLVEAARKYQRLQ